MKIGKLPNDVLKDIIISDFEKKNKEVIVGPEIGEDCSIVDFGETICVLTTDPITAADSNAGRIGINICCNDVASAGVRPLGVLVTLLVPPSCVLDDIKNVNKQISDTCKELSIDVLGGHTEITDAVNRIVISITAIGKGGKNQYVTTGGAKAGDDIVITGYAAMEGTAILASDFNEYLSDKLSSEEIFDGQNILKSISVVKAGLIAAKYGVNAMHDATEGGILGAVWEVAEASKKGVYIFKDKIPVKQVTLDICNIFNINPYRLISSGSMIITCKDGEKLCEILEAEGIKASVIGKIIEGSKIIKSENKEFDLEPPDTDEIYKIVNK